MLRRLNPNIRIFEKLPFNILILKYANIHKNEACLTLLKLYLQQLWVAYSLKTLRELNYSTLMFLKLFILEIFEYLVIFSIFVFVFDQKSTYSLPS